jgi:hypothetical protein
MIGMDIRNVKIIRWVELQLSTKVQLHLLHQIAGATDDYYL